MLEYFILEEIVQKVNRTIQGVPQSEAATNPWHKQEEKKENN